MRIVLLDDFSPIINQTLSSWKWQVINGQNWTLEDFKKNARHLEGIIIRSKFPLDKEHLTVAKKLKFIARPGSGLENIDLKYCEENNIEVFRSPEGNRDALAEHTLGMLLSLINHLNVSDSEVRNHIWEREKNRGSELKGKVMAIIGYGHMGKAFAQRLNGFEMEVIAYDKYISGFGTNHVKEVNLEEIFQRADFVSLHTPLSSETAGMMNSSFFEKFKKPFIVINTARGKSLVLEDLIDSLNSKKIIGACLDVLDIESSNFSLNKAKNQSFEKLKKFNNVVLSPHIAGWSFESKEKMAKVILEKIHVKFIL
ncbi:MAG: hydroxyacid dehydrogenase [Crocinitomicaceae bacterium]|nr:hydroxyacid dehydrogenase [Crocinitomicaceae bacterium]